MLAHLRLHLPSAFGRHLPFARRSHAAHRVPLDAPSSRRSRTQRGGSHAPLLLMPVIAIVAGVAIAYVSQTAHATTATYQASTLQSQQRDLQLQNSRDGEQLAQLQSTERIAAAAQQIGLRPAGQWSYVASVPAQFVTPSAPSVVAQAEPSDPFQRLVATLSTPFTLGSAEAASR